MGQFETMPHVAPNYRDGIVNLIIRNEKKKNMACMLRKPWVKENLRICDTLNFNDSLENPKLQVESKQEPQTNTVILYISRNKDSGNVDVQLN